MKNVIYKLICLQISIRFPVSCPIKMSHEGIVSRLVFEYTVQLQGDIHDCINGINKLQHAEILSLYRYTNMRSKQ